MYIDLTRPNFDSDNHIGDAGVAALAALLGDGIPATTSGEAEQAQEAVEGKQCPGLQELCLGYNDIGHIGA